MNKTRRKQIEKALEELTGIKERIEEFKSMVEGIKDEEQDYYDNVPENLQGTERYETSEQAADNLDVAFQAIESVESSLEEVEESLTSSME